MAKVSLRAYNREIETMIDSGHLDEAIAHSKHILKTFPKHLDTYRLLGKAYLEYKRYPDAVDVFSRVLVVSPNDFVSHVGMSIIRDEENKLDDAIWHMERAFETQPSNSAIQSELQRLYSRRDGVQLPRIRMTRGALAQMYVQGELYPQAISEIKSVLKEDPGRNDMQVLLARAYYRSGLKNDAAEVASSLLRVNPYCLDANRVLVDILGADHPESVQAYRQRVIELDPYASQVSGSTFSSNEVPDLAVTVERLDWNGQPVSGPATTWEAQAPSLESGQRSSDEQPDWLKGAFQEAPHEPAQAAPSFDTGAQTFKPAEPAEEIPDFLKAAGWGQSTGTFDESKPVYSDEESAPSGQPLEQGDLPDWIKAMAPQQPAESAPQEQTPESEEEMPDWINKIGTSALPIPSESSDQLDWMNQTEQPAAQPAEEQPDWLKQFSTSEQSSASSEEQPDWLKGFENEADSGLAKPSTGELDWLSQFGQEAKPAEPAADEFDFLNQPAGEPAASTAPADEFDFLKDIGNQPEPAAAAAAAASTDDFDFLNELTSESDQLAPASSIEGSANKDNLGKSEQEQDDSFAWLESLAAKQGATEGLLTTPEERLEEEPDWIKQAKGLEAEQPAVTQPAANLQDLGKSEQEQDDSFSWLESLAAKQGATEGLLTKPEDRLEQEPEWIKQAKSLKEQTPQVPPTPVPPELPEAAATEPEPTASLQDLGKSEQEQDDSFAWLESLAAKQGATEGLLTTPEERLEEEPDWIKQAKDLRAEQLSTPEQAPSADDTAAWLKSLDQEETSEPQAVSSSDETGIWFRKLEESTEPPSQPVEPETAPAEEELPAWMQNMEEDRSSETLFNIPIPGHEPEPKAVEKEADLPEATEWMSSIGQESVTEPAASAEEQRSELPAEEIPSWLSELDREEEQAVTSTPMDADLPAWLRDETGESVVEPTRIEPTRASDWQPAQREAELEPVMQQPEPQTPAPEPEPVAAQPQVVAPEPEPEPVVAKAEPQPPQPQPAEVVSIIEERIAAVQEPAPVTEPPRKTPKPKGTGKLSMPLDPVLGQARNELAGSNLNSALENYGRLIKKGRFLDEVIYDLRDAAYRFPVDFNLWQSLGDAYMRANRLQDALDAYTKAEELLR